MSLRRFLRCERGSPSVEMVLVLPMLLPLLFGGLEAGHFFWTEHKLVKAVRDGARFASRLEVESLCDGPNPAAGQGDFLEVVNLMTRTGQLADANANPTVPGWTDIGVTVTVSCEAFVATGIYSDLGAAGPIVTVSAENVPYPSLLNELGIVDPDIEMTASSHAPVIGI